MEFKQLNYFVEIANQEHMTEAALTLNIAQSALSRQISMLEDELGVKLFKRQGRNIKLTEDGHLFLKEAVEILEAVERSKMVLSDEADKDKRTLNISLTPTDMTGKVMQSLTHVVNTEDVEAFSIVDIPDVNLTSAVYEGVIDIALSPVKMPGSEMRSMLLFEQNYRYVFRENSAVNLPKNARMSEIVEYPLASFNPILNMKDKFQNAEINNFNDLTIIQHLLMSHGYVAIVTPDQAKLLKHYYPALIDYSLNHLNITQPLYLSMKADSKKTFTRRWFNQLRQSFQLEIDNTFPIRY